MVSLFAWPIFRDFVILPIPDPQWIPPSPYFLFHPFCLDSPPRHPTRPLSRRHDPCPLPSSSVGCPRLWRRCWLAAGPPSAPLAATTTCPPASPAWSASCESWAWTSAAGGSSLFYRFVGDTEDFFTLKRTERPYKRANRTTHWALRRTNKSRVEGRE